MWIDTSQKRDTSSDVSYVLDQLIVDNFIETLSVTSSNSHIEGNMLDTKIVLFLVVASFTFQPICFVYSAPYFTGILNAGKDAGGTLELGRAGKTIAGAADASGTGGRLSSGQSLHSTRSNDYIL